VKEPLNDKGVIHRYRQFLPVSDSTPVISLSEGSTPLIHSPRLSEKASAEVYLKFEGLNPTGSFKDRGMTYAVSKALEDGAKTIICASTGNTSAAAAAYAAKAGIQCVVLIPEGNIACNVLLHDERYMYLKYQDRSNKNQVFYATHFKCTELSPLAVGIPDTDVSEPLCTIENFTPFAIKTITKPGQEIIQKFPPFAYLCQ
jgi:hypothetical protein